MFFKRINILSLSSSKFKYYSTLNSAQVAFANRIGLKEVLPAKLLLPLSHPTLKKDSDPSEFQNLLKTGNIALNYFTREYLKNRFPSMDEKYLKIGMGVFLEDKNILQLARFIGIDAACGTDVVTAEDGLDLKSIHLDCFKALIGFIGIEYGPLALRKFLDSRYFNNSLFNPKDLVRPLYPIPDLSKLYPNLVFRLHQESGRLSSNSMFIIGAYADESAETCLGEGFGASQALAQHRAATEALRNLNLVERKIKQRPSDNVSSISDILNTI